MIYKVRLGEQIINGMPIDIIEAARRERFLGEDIALDDFVKEIQQNIWRLYGKGIRLNHDLPIEEKCQQLVQQLIDQGLLIKC